MPEVDTTVNQARIIIPVRNGGARWREAAAALRAAVADPTLVAVVDSGSSDGSDQVAAESGFEIERIDPRTFNHGRTRQMAVDRFCEGRELAVFLTHDAVLEGRESLDELLAAFRDPQVGVAYGRQLPHRQAGPFEAHMVLFNYGTVSETRSLADAPRLGIKTAYTSNSFGAYRLSALRACGGFPSHLILGEDTCVAVKMLLSGWKVRYCAEARVRHSHAYTIVQETQRYFDFGVLHAQLPELMRNFGAAEGEGARFVRSELRYMLAHAPRLLPAVLIRNSVKYAGYRLGRAFTRLPRSLCRRLSMTKVFWNIEANHIGPTVGPDIMPR
ncbi:MAG TPA: glycosyltransferase [Steroidobacteraceae bacterium]|nr:glycosyltransferase [Steroidobacteraceae bacterium]